MATLELGPADLAALRLLARPDVVAALRVHNTGAALAEAAIRAVEHASALGIIHSSGDGFTDFLEAGRVVQRVWLAATRLGIAFQPMSPLTFMARMLDDPSGNCFDPQERLRIRELSTRLTSTLRRAEGCTPAFLFRLGRAGDLRPPYPASLCRIAGNERNPVHWISPQG